MRHLFERYISLGEWFDAGTEAFPLIPWFGDDLDTTLMLGIKDGEWDQEVCGLDEFLVLGHHSE